MSLRSRRSRRAFSLFEMLLALAILVAVMAVVSEAVRQGLDLARRARDLTEAQLLAEGIMEQVAVGLIPLEPLQGAPLATGNELSGDTQWLFSLQVEPIDEEGLLAVGVEVVQDLPASSKPVRFELVQWITDEQAAYDPTRWDSQDSATGDDTSDGGGGR